MKKFAGWEVTDNTELHKKPQMGRQEKEETLSSEYITQCVSQQNCLGIKITPRVRSQHLKAAKHCLSSGRSGCSEVMSTRKI